MSIDRIELNDGDATIMGDGVFAISQIDEHGVAQSVVLTKEDIEALQNAG